jgi:hypothetical protein
MWNVVFWVMTLYSLLDGNQHFGVVNHLHHQASFQLEETESESQRGTEVGENMFLQNAGNKALTYRTVQCGITTRK